jgi:hypothetical protein
MSHIYLSLLKLQCIPYFTLKFWGLGLSAAPMLKKVADLSTEIKPCDEIVAVIAVK